MHHFLTSVVLVALATTASADTVRPAAAPYLERGLRLYATQQYADAIGEYEAGYQIDPHPDFLYAIGQAQRLRGDCKSATEAYRAYLRTDPPTAEAARTNEQIARCAAMLAPPPPPPRHETFGPTGYVFAAGSIAALGAGALFLVAGSSRADDADRARNLADRNDHEAWARNYRIAGGVALAGGVSLGAFTVIRYLRTRETTEPNLQPTVQPGATSVSVGAAWRF